MSRRDSRLGLMFLVMVCSFRLAEVGALLFGNVEDVGGDGSGENSAAAKEDELGTDDEDGAVGGWSDSTRFEDGLSPGAET